MDRAKHHPRTDLIAALLLTALVVPSMGCVNALATAIWVVKGTNEPAEFDGLKGKRVAVVCRPPASMEFTTTSSARDLSIEMGRLLRAHVKKIDVVDHREVDKWIDQNDWESAQEIGRAVDADIVVSIELEDLRFYEGQTMYRGKVDLSMRVYDLKNEDEIIYEKMPPTILYPTTTGVPTSEKQLKQFQRDFIKVLASQMARTFYAYDSKEHFAADSTAFN